MEKNPLLMRDPPWVLSFSQNCGTTNKTKSQLCSDGQFVLWLEKQEAERNSSKSNKGLELLLKIKGEQLPSKCEAFVQIPASQTKGKGRNRRVLCGGFLTFWERVGSIPEMRTCIPWLLA
jgi:hypothetical protein